MRGKGDELQYIVHSAYCIVMMIVNIDGDNGDNSVAIVGAEITKYR